MNDLRSAIIPKWRLPLIVVLVAVGLGVTLVYFRSPPPVKLFGEFKSEVQRAREEEVGIELRHWLDWVYENKHSILPGDSVDAVPAYYSV